MAPKKKINRKEKVLEGQPEATISEVEKTFLDLQIAECNRIIARLRTNVHEYEVRNEELKKAYDRLDKDRTDVIEYLRRTLKSKNEENDELKNKVKELEETKYIKNTQFREKAADIERNFIIIKDRLKCENKLLSAKLNTLEEFRRTRDDLMRKFERQEEAFQNQDMQHKRKMYDIEKKFVIEKDKLKNDIEARLLQMSQDFQDSTELRIAASTRRVVRENIAIYNELDSILSTQKKLTDQNGKYKKSERAARMTTKLAEEERNKIINKNLVQQKLIDELTTMLQELKKERDVLEKTNGVLKAKVKKLTDENENLSMQVQFLKQKRSLTMTDQNESNVKLPKVDNESVKLKKMLKEVAVVVEAALKLEQWIEADPMPEIADRKYLLPRLMEIITEYNKMQHTQPITTLTTFERIYEKGDLGFVCKPTAKNSTGRISSRLSLLEQSVTKDEIQIITTNSLSSSTPSSLNTIPSIKVIPKSSKLEVVSKGSLPSFVTSSQTNNSLITVNVITDESFMTDVEQKLAESRSEIQKSLMKEIAYMQSFKINLESQKVVIDEPEKEVGSCQSVQLEWVTNDGNEQETKGNETVESEHDEKKETVEGEHGGKETVEDGYVEGKESVECENEEKKESIEDKDVDKIVIVEDERVKRKKFFMTTMI